MNYSADALENETNPVGDNSLKKTPKKESTVSNTEKDYIPTWFIRLFFIMIILMILSIWLIPDDTFIRWSMWWNNIPLD
ncbi:MAG: hypothetical protein WBM02_03980 [bacterium]